MELRPGTEEGAPRLLDFKQERIRTLHYTWIAFFMTFYVWFNMAPLSTTMLDSVGWLTEEHVKILLIANVALTIPARIVVGALIDRYGARVVFSGLMVVMAIPAVAFAMGNSFMQLLIARLVLSSVGAGFVIGIKMVAQWFPPKYIGRAEGFYAGWGNFGSAFAAMTLPWFAITVMDGWFGLGDDAWRWAMAINGLVMGVYGVMYYFLVRDVPKGAKLRTTKKTEPMMVTSYGDLAQYLVWSMPLMGALGVLAWRISNVKIDGEPVISSTVLWLIYGVLAVIYVMHVVKTLQINLPYLRKGVPADEKYHWGSVAALNSTYFANFGAELAVVSMLPAFFELTFEPLTNSAGDPLVTATVAGVVAASFAFVNLVARPLGGYLSDRMTNRKRTMLIYMLGIVIGFFLMAFIGKWDGTVDADGLRNVVPAFGGISWLIVAVLITVFASVFVQGAEGATFAIIPMINKRMTGQIAGMAGAYGNVGAVIYLVIFSLVDARTFFFVLSGGALLSFLVTFFMLEEPKEAFADTLDHDLDLEVTA
ncbi:MAG TPA: MFS transporter [Acidimicrobiia bacterium]|jgi:NNP family nitrate/nitrite transporter-like MFS transporter|nr:MFS transporter [Acidimicrobiia bacterium]